MSLALKELSSHHLSMIEKTVFESATTRELSAEFDLTPTYVSQLKGTDLWKEEEEKLRKELHGKHLSELTQLRGPAIEALKDGVNVNEETALRLKAAKEILDRTGFSPGQDVNRQGSNVINLFLPQHLKPKDVVEKLTEDAVEAEVVESE